MSLENCTSEQIDNTEYYIDAGSTMPAFNISATGELTDICKVSGIVDRMEIRGACSSTDPKACEGVQGTHTAIDPNTISKGRNGNFYVDPSTVPGR